MKSGYSAKKLGYFTVRILYHTLLPKQPTNVATVLEGYSTLNNVSSAFVREIVYPANSLSKYRICKGHYFEPKKVRQLQKSSKDSDSRSFLRQHYTVDASRNETDEIVVTKKEPK